MHPDQYAARSFLVRVWLEEPGAEEEQAVWRGYVTVLPDGSSRYVDSLDHVCDAIVEELRELGLDA